MGTWNNANPKQLVLAEWEKESRRTNIKDYSASPVEYEPISPVPDIYTHVGNACNYGYGRRNGRTVRLLIVHTTETDTFTGNMSYSARRPETVSATAYIGKDGEIGYDVPEWCRPYTTGRWNDESLSIEICGKMSYSESYWRSRPAQIESIIKLLTDWCIRYDIPPVYLSPEAVAEGASPHGTTPRQGVNKGISDHWDCNLAARILGASTSSTSHNDVGPGMRAVLFQTIMPEVARRVNATQPPATPPTNTEEEMIVLPSPTRIYDSRDGGNKVAAGNVVTVTIPYSDAKSAFVNITVAHPEAKGHIRAWGSGTKPDVSNLNYQPWTNVCNTSWVPIDNGKISVYTTSKTHIIVDLQAVSV